MLYNSLILERYKHPRHRGELSEPHASVEDVNPLCGDRIRIDLRVADGLVEAARFRGDACAISVASADLLIGMVEGEPVARARGISREELLKALEARIRPSRLQCVELPLQVLQQALQGVTR